MTTIRIAYNDALARRIEEGDTGALVKGVACMAALWLEQNGYDRQFWHRVTPGDCLGMKSPGTAAAALSLLQLLSRSPQGRQAIADVGFQPFDQQPEDPSARPGPVSMVGEKGPRLEMGEISRAEVEKELRRRGLPVEPESAQARRRTRRDGDPEHAS